MMLQINKKGTILSEEQKLVLEETGRNLKQVQTDNTPMDIAFASQKRKIEETIQLRNGTEKNKELEENKKVESTARKMTTRRSNKLNVSNNIKDEGGGGGTE